MIEKIKCHLASFFTCQRVRYGCVAVVTALAIVAVTLLSSSIHTVEIFDGETTYTVRTLNRNTVNVFDWVDLKHDNYDIVDTSVEGSTTTVEIEYCYPVYVTNGDTTHKVEFSGGTVEEALNMAGFSLDEYDFVEPAKDTVIDGTVYIDYVNIDYVKGSYTEDIPYKTETVYSDKIDKGVTTLTEGTKGVNKITYTEKFINGESVEKEVTNTAVVVKPVNAKKVIGTKVAKKVVKKQTVKKNKAVKTSSNVKSVSVLEPRNEIQLDKNGNPVNYKKKITARATAYTHTGNKCATGVAPKPGYIAVNPKVIPYGTKMYIKTADGNFVYGYAVAADTGGFIKKHPTGVDLFMDTRSACVNFGVKNVEIYILE